MSYKDKPQIKLYKYVSNSFVLQAQIDDFQEVSFEHTIYQAGTFTITINYNIPNALKFERGLFVQIGNNPYDFGEIITIQDSIGEDGKGSQTRTITGYDARYILKRRVIKNMNSNGLWVMTDKGELVLRNLIKDQCGAGAEAKRQLPITNTIPASSSAIGKDYSVSEQFSNLYEVCKTIATQSEIGWRFAFDGSGLTLEVYEGTDRSQTVKFDTSFESLANGDFTDSSDSFSNAIYVGGKGQNDDRDIYEGEDVSAGTPSGLDRFESWDNQSSMTTESEYEAEALSMLTQYGQTLTMSGNGLAKCPYVFREEYDIGDSVTVAFSGKSAVAQILSITEHWSWGAYDIQFSFGKPQNNLADQLQLMLRKIQDASNKTNSTDSVRWYTIPTDTAMPKADVTYSHIGFVGTVGTGATFTLYLDSEKTGAKTYHVYFKQLGGTGKLTLTTGVSGATDLVLNAGTYVAIIYVDENGNITNTASTPTATIEAGSTQPATSGGVQQAISQIAETNVIYDSDITDCNNMYQMGKSVCYYAPSSTSNVPNSNNAWYILSQCNPSSVSGYAYITQFAKTATTSSNEVYTRHAYLNNGAMTWSPWNRLYKYNDLTEYEKGFTLSSPQWIKVCTFGYRNYGEVLEVKVVSNYANIPSASHIIRIAYGWVDFTVEDIASDSGGVFDKIRVCWNSNNTDEMALFVHYNSSLANGMYWKTEGLAFRVSKVYAVNADPTTYANYKEYNLRTGGTGGSLNGQRFTVTPNVYATELDRNSESDRISAMSVLTADRGNSGIGTIRYASGYYYYYSWNITTGSEQVIIETNPYNGTINIYKKDSTNTISRIRTI